MSLRKTLVLAAFFVLVISAVILGKIRISHKSVSYDSRAFLIDGKRVLLTSAAKSTARKAKNTWSISAIRCVGSASMCRLSPALAARPDASNASTARSLRIQSSNFERCSPMDPNSQLNFGQLGTTSGARSIKSGTLMTSLSNR